MSISKIQTVVVTLQSLHIEGQMQYLKQYIESIIDECAENAKVEVGAIWEKQYVVNKDSILEIKEQL